MLIVETPSPSAPDIHARSRRSLLGPLWLQVLLGMALGIATGVFFPHRAIELKPFGDDFILLIRMTLAPIIFSTVAVGIARMGDLRAAGRVGIKALIYFEVVSTLALALGLVAIDLLHPGRGMNIDPAKLDTSAIAAFTTGAQHIGIAPFLTGILPTSIAEPFVTGNILQVIFLGVLFGIALVPLRNVAKPLINLLDLILRLMFGIVGVIMLFAPLAAFGAMAYTVGQYGVASLRPLAIFTAEQWSVSAFFVAVVLGLIARAAGFSLARVLAFLRDELLITAATSSSEAVLAPVMLKLEEYGCSSAVVGMVMPAGYAFNADGTAIYLSMGAIFLAQATNTHLGLREQITLLLVLMLTSKGSGGVAGAGFIALAATIAAMHSIPAAALVLLLSVERITNIPRAVVNVIGSSVATIVIAKWEKAFDARGSSGLHAANFSGIDS